MDFTGPPGSQFVEPCSLRQRDIRLAGFRFYIREATGVPCASQEFEAVNEPVSRRLLDRQFLECPVIVQRENRDDSLASGEAFQNGPPQRVHFPARTIAALVVEQLINAIRWTILSMSSAAAGTGSFAVNPGSNTGISLRRASHNIN